MIQVLPEVAEIQEEDYVETCGGEAGEKLEFKNFYVSDEGTD